MEELAEILERELKEAFQVKDPDSLHRSAQLIAERLVEQQTYDRDHAAILSELKELSSSMKQGFALMDERFAAQDRKFEALQKQMDVRFTAQDRHFEALQKQMDERFNASDKRFSDLHRFMSLGFTALALLVAAFNIVHILVK